jgi:hypothetical protein
VGKTKILNLRLPENSDDMILSIFVKNNDVWILILQNEVDEAVKVLLGLKAEYKAMAGSEWKPGCIAPTAKSSASNAEDANVISEKIVAQGNKVRDLKASKAAKVSL